MTTQWRNQETDKIKFIASEHTHWGVESWLSIEQQQDYHKICMNETLKCFLLSLKKGYSFIKFNA